MSDKSLSGRPPVVTLTLQEPIRGDDRPTTDILAADLYGPPPAHPIKSMSRRLTRRHVGWLAKPPSVLRWSV